MNGIMETYKLTSKGNFISSWTFCGFAIVFLLFDSISKIVQAEMAFMGTVGLGALDHLMAYVGSVFLAGFLFYVMPKILFVALLVLAGCLIAVLADVFI